ncbi:hypothetical protein PR202_gb27440 [Eleusine coracana subsp. coracana]|uniref:Zinc knuckle CX2CX4HX4C domain-containing protein n=1 Tax=Eleusine coracana subsp. coracana TaxID=191504 RepID=A0AAV5FUB8_ELECO|nr:hypothetical protein PR202_gb27440 [Eleusine coracana subsp. coracana]
MAGTQGEKGKATAAEAMGSEPSIEERLKGLKLMGEEEKELDFFEEIEDLVKEARWMVLFRVETTKPFSHAALLNAMRTAWAAAKTVTFKVKADNLFLAHFHWPGDWLRVMEGGPWLSRGAPVVMAEYDGLSNIHEYKLNKIPVWTRIQGIPEALMKKKEIAEKIARKVGEPPITVIANEGKINPTPYLRARVFLDLEKPLVRMVPITLKEKMKCLVQYEKLPMFCSVCGIVGHEMTECGDGTHEASKCEWGDWLLVNFSTSIYGRGAGRGGGTRDGTANRGRGRGRRANNTSEEDYTDESNGEYDELQKSIVVQRKRTGRGDNTVADPTDVGATSSAGVVAGTVMLLEKNNSTQELSPQNTQEKKRQKKQVGAPDPAIFADVQRKVTDENE